MRDLARHPELLSLNTATVRERWNLQQIIDGCLRHGVKAIAPWREQVQAMGLDAAAKALRTRPRVRRAAGTRSRKRRVPSDSAL